MLSCFAFELAFVLGPSCVKGYPDTGRVKSNQIKSSQIRSDQHATADSHSLG